VTSEPLGFLTMAANLFSLFEEEIRELARAVVRTMRHADDSPQHSVSLTVSQCHFNWRCHHVGHDGGHDVEG
jgi:hypothetical protein